MKLTKKQLQKRIKRHIREAKAFALSHKKMPVRAIGRSDDMPEESEEEEEFATAAGMEQDIESRHGRGSFEKGDWGIHGPTGYTDRGGLAGEYSGYGDYPWIQSALKDLQDEEHPNKVKALEALADELGMSIEVTPDEEPEEEELAEYRRGQYAGRGPSLRREKRPRHWSSPYASRAGWPVNEDAKLTKKELKQIIREEYKAVMERQSQQDKLIEWMCTDDERGAKIRADVSAAAEANPDGLEAMLKLQAEQKCPEMWLKED